MPEFDHLAAVIESAGVDTVYGHAGIFVRERGAVARKTKNCPGASTVPFPNVKLIPEKLSPPRFREFVPAFFSSRNSNHRHRPDRRRRMIHDFRDEQFAQILRRIKTCIRAARLQFVP
jgi:hypothetical protein